MGAPRGKSRLIDRRRTDDGDDDVLVGGEESLSEPSVPSDVDDDADGEGSETSEIGTPFKGRPSGKSLETSRYSEVASTTGPIMPADVEKPETMFNSLTIADGSGDAIEEIEVDSDHAHAHPIVNLPPPGTEAPDKAKSLGERRRREHEEYKKRRDADPSFVPNRGEFFMHDQRNTGQDKQGQVGFRSGQRTRGRGRGGLTNASLAFRDNIEDGPWKHDLHQSVAEQERPRPEPVQTAADTVPGQYPKLARSNEPLPNRDFSSTTTLGIVNCQVLLPGMQSAVPFSGVPQNLHIRLPHHRPPLRRDKPVRVSLPDCAPSYVFPAEYRSFVFIPRALRPNQQGFGRPRGRGSFGGLGGLRSGRTSLYGGSAYTPSIGMSRRSSFARDREGMASPAMSVMSRATGPVRGPPGNASMMPPHSFKHGMSTGYAHVPMHQPRPTKNIAMPDAESPGLYASGGTQPFAHQVPSQYGSDYRSDSRRTSYPSQRGTPLGQIPERNFNGPPMQAPFPGTYPQGPMPAQGYAQGPPPVPMYYPQQQYQKQAYPYYYPQQPPPPPGQQYGPGPSGPVPGPGAQVPMAPPGPQANSQPYGYMGPAPAAPLDANGQANMVAHESNGTIYYYDQSQMAADAAAAAYPSGMMPYGVPPVYMGPPPPGPMYYPPQ